MGGGVEEQLVSRAKKVTVSPRDEIFSNINIPSIFELLVSNRVLFCPSSFCGLMSCAARTHIVVR